MEHFGNWSLIFSIIYYVVLGFGDGSSKVLKFASEHAAKNTTFTVIVDYGRSSYLCDRRFLSVTIDTYEVDFKWNEFKFGSLKLQNLASGLSPCDIRLGGTYADFLTFDPNGAASGEVGQDKDLSRNKGFQLDSGYFNRNLSGSINNFTLTGKQWDVLTSFFEKVGWDLMFDFNIFKWRGDLWDPANAEVLLKYSSERGVKIPYFQLGNEPNAYFHNFNVTVSPETLVKDFTILKNLISKYPLYKNSELYGPDVTNLDNHRQTVQYLQDFISSGAYSIVNGITLHHYYCNGRTAKERDFISISMLDDLKVEIDVALNVSRASPVPLPILFTETSSCYGGGAADLSDAYIAGFMWLDKLGLAAKNGFKRVFRQTFLGGRYGFLDDNSNTNPDYYLSVLYKRLIEGPVFNVSLYPPDEHVRIYAHCAHNTEDQSGLVIYFLNLQNTTAVLSLPQFQYNNISLYLLTPGDDAGLLSRNVKLNGEILRISDDKLPEMRPKPHQGNIIVDAWSFGFIVVNDSNIPLCIKYFADAANID